MKINCKHKKIQFSLLPMGDDDAISSIIFPPDDDTIENIVFYAFSPAAGTRTLFISRLGRLSSKRPVILLRVSIEEVSVETEFSWTVLEDWYEEQALFLAILNRYKGLLRGAVEAFEKKFWTIKIK